MEGITRRKHTRKVYTPATRALVCEKINALVDDGHTYKEIAEILDIPAGTISVWRSYGLVKDTWFTAVSLAAAATRKENDAARKLAEEAQTEVELQEFDEPLQDPPSDERTLIQQLLTISQAVERISEIIERRIPA